MALKISLILLFVLLLSQSLLIDASPALNKCDITKNSHEPNGLPSILIPPAKFKFLLHASGVQIYKCNTTTSKKSWDLVGPKADLFVNSKNKPVGKHYFQPTPVNEGRATWNSTLNCDQSSVIGKVIQTYPVESKNIPWLLIKSTKNEGRENEAFTDITHIVRTNTKDGVAPPIEECGTKYSNNDLFKSYYTTDYWYYH